MNLIFLDEKGNMMAIVGGSGSNPWDLFLKRTTCVTKTQSKNIINDFLVFTHGKLPRSSITYNFQVKCAIFKKRRKRRFQKKHYIHWINIAADSRLIQTYRGRLCVNINKNNLHLICFSKVTVNKSWHYQVKTNWETFIKTKPYYSTRSNLMQ